MILLAANLSALFAFLFMRKSGIGLLGAVLGAWTFACSGYFASRILAGHIPLLEVYCTLPLLLWLVESLNQARQHGNAQPLDLRPRSRKRLRDARGTSAALGVCSRVSDRVRAVARRDHRAVPRRVSDALVPITSIALGVGCASFVLVPMMMLIGRSTRCSRCSRGRRTT